MNANDLTYGVELEGTVESRSNMPIGTYHNGEPVTHTGGKYGLRKFKAERDGSIVTRTRKPVELVSPILQGETGFYHLYAALENVMIDAGFKVNLSCGTHVHVGAQDLDPDMIARVVNAFRLYEKAFFALNGRHYWHRWDSSYCKPSEQWVSPMHDRYQSLNLSNLGSSRKNTIEVRCWKGTNDYRFAITAISMIVGLVAFAADDPQFDRYQGTIADPSNAVDRFCADVWGNDASEYTVISISDEKDPEHGPSTRDPSDYVSFLREQAKMIPPTRPNHR